jgi:hypothetical protein
MLSGLSVARFFETLIAIAAIDVLFLKVSFSFSQNSINVEYCEKKASVETRFLEWLRRSDRIQF